MRAGCHLRSAEVTARHHGATLDKWIKISLYVLMDDLLSVLRTVAEETRLWILALASRDQLTVSEFVDVLGQSQPRVSRHLKLLVEAGLLERIREGQWAYFRLARELGSSQSLVREVIARLPLDDSLLAADQARLADLKRR